MKILEKVRNKKLMIIILAIIIVISDLASAPMSSRGLSLLDGVIPIITLLLAYLIFLLLNHSSNKVQDIVCGKPVLIIKDGKIVEKEFNSQKYTVSDLMSQLHEKDVFSISDVKYGILETNGNLSVIKNDPNIETLPVNVIEDGKLSDANMELLGISKGDVERLVKAKKVKIEDILVGQMDSNYKFTYQLKEKEV